MTRSKKGTNLVPDKEARLLLLNRLSRTAHGFQCYLTERTYWHWQIVSEDRGVVCDLWPTVGKLRRSRTREATLLVFDADEMIGRASDILTKVTGPASDAEPVRPVAARETGRTRMAVAAPASPGGKRYARVDAEYDGDELRLIVNSAEFSMSVRLSPENTQALLKKLSVRPATTNQSAIDGLLAYSQRLFNWTRPEQDGFQK